MRFDWPSNLRQFYGTKSRAQSHSLTARQSLARICVPRCLPAVEKTLCQTLPLLCRPRLVTSRGYATARNGA